MKIQFNPLLLGLFVLGGIGIALLGLVGLGSSLFHPVGHFVFYLPNSAGGLDQGSGVKLNGIQVGRVDRIRIYYDPKARKAFVGVTCEIDKDILVDPQGHPINLTKPETVRGLVAHGLIVQVQTAGLVGTEFVELGFNSSEQPYSQKEFPSARYPIVPAVPSAMSELKGNLSGMLSNLRAIDYRGLIQQVTGVLASARGQINELQTNHLTDHISSAAQSVGNFMTSSDLRAAVARLQAAAATFQGLITNLNARVAPAGTNLNATLISARDSAQSLSDFLKLRDQLGEQTYELMDQLNETARSIEQLSDFLQQHPNALISGRARPKKAP